VTRRDSGGPDALQADRLQANKNLTYHQATRVNE